MRASRQLLYAITELQKKKPALLPNRPLTGSLLEDFETLHFGLTSVVGGFCDATACTWPVHFLI